MSNPVALLTDFGEQDGYVGVLRLAMLRLFPELTVVDISHGIAPGAILSASWALASAVPWAPRGTVFCAVVDPGIGSDRAVLVARWPSFTVVAPDNGLISLCVRLYGEPFCYTTTTDELQTALGVRHESIPTFHCLDLFTPLAGALALSHEVPLSPYATPVLLPTSRKVLLQDTGAYALQVMHWDRFGNGILDLHKSEIVPENDLSQARLHGRGVELDEASHTYSDVASGELLFYWGRTGWLEVAVRDGSAFERLQGSTEPMHLVLS